MKRNQSGTRQSLSWLRGTPDVAQEAQQIQESIALNRRGAAIFLSLLTVVSNRKALLIAIGLMTAEQFGGSAIMPFYAYLFLRSAGIGHGSSDNLIHLIIPSIYILTTICVVFLADRVGRKPLLLASAILCAICLLAIGVHMQLHDISMDNAGNSYFPLVVYIGYLISSSIGLGTLPSVVAAEIFPCEVKGFALGVTIAYRFAITIGIALLWPVALHLDIGIHVIFYIFVLLNILSAVFIFFVVPETKTHSFSEIQTILQKPFKIQF